MRGFEAPDARSDMRVRRRAEFVGLWRRAFLEGAGLEVVPYSGFVLLIRADGAGTLEGYGLETIELGRRAADLLEEVRP